MWVLHEGGRGKEGGRRAEGEKWREGGMSDYVRKEVIYGVRQAWCVMVCVFNVCREKKKGR